MIDYDLYKQAIEDVVRINALDKTSVTNRLCKVYEEAGELTQAINKTLGRKVVDETEDEVKDNILEEMADTLQCIYSWWDTSSTIGSSGANYLLEIMSIPLKHNNKAATVLLQLYKHIADASDNEDVGIYKISYIVTELIMLAQCFGYTFDDLNRKVLEKNKKWEAVVERKKEQEKEGKFSLFSFGKGD
jgi:uncharacterized protein YfaA (DUF2138 family)